MLLLCKCPQLLNYRAATLRERALYLQDELSLDVARMVMKRPMILTYSVEAQLKPCILYLKSLGSSTWTGWRRIVQTYPQVLQYPVDSYLKPKVAYLTTLLSNKRQDAIHMVASNPTILWLRPELIESKLDFLQQALELDKQELHFVVTSFPQVLGLSVETNLQPKLEYLKQHLTMDQLKEFVAYQPSLLAYSLENRIRPRIELLVENDIAFGYSPLYLMSLTNVRFQKW